MDKNGKQTTVYRRAEAPGSHAAHIPAPVVVPRGRDEVAEQIDRIIDEIDESVAISGEGERGRIKSTLESYSPNFLSVVEESLQHLETVTIASVLIQNGESQSLVSEALTFMPQVETERFYERLRVVQSLHSDYYPGLRKVEDYGVADKHLQSQCLAIFKVTLAMKQHSEDRSGDLRMAGVGPEKVHRAAIMSDQRMIALVLEKPEKADLIVDTIRERRTGDFGVIHAVVNQEAIALSSGTL